MGRTTSLLLLVLAAALEAGGDALIRQGLYAKLTFVRVFLFSVGGLVLFAYGLVVNTPPWNFGRLLGLYVVFFFVFAQILSWLMSKETPSISILLGGSLIVGGGIVIALGGSR